MASHTALTCKLSLLPQKAMQAIHLVVVVLAAFPEVVATLVKGRKPFLAFWAMLILLQL